MITSIYNTNDAKNIQFKNDFKQKHNTQNTIVMFRLGNTYKVYQEDAKVLYDKLGTNIENNSVEFSHNMLDVYLPRLVRCGYRIAITDQQ